MFYRLKKLGGFIFDSIFLRIFTDYSVNIVERLKKIKQILFENVKLLSWSHSQEVRI